jgi:hypothetical protein
LYGELSGAESGGCCPAFAAFHSVACVGNQGKSVPNVVVTPDLTLKYSFKVEAGAGYTLGITTGNTYKITMPDVSGNLAADGKPK